MKKIFIFMLPAILMVSCVKSLDDYNIDTKRPVSVSAGSLFVNGTKVLTDLLTTPNVNTNVFRFYMQQWSATTYTDEPRYDFETRNIPLNIWNPMYRTVLINLQESKKVAEEDALTNAAVKANQVAATEVLSVLAWSILVNIWGDIPYTEALGEANQPKYDDAKTIYADLFARLNTAIGQMTPSAGGFGSSDLIYGGNTAQWIKFANSLKLRLAITIADVDATSAKTAFDAAKDNAFASNDDNAAFGYLSATPNNNPISNNLVPPFTSRQDYIIASTIVDEMNALADPRRDFYFSNKIDGEYKGSAPGSVAPYSLFSHVSDKITAPDFEALLIDFSEVQFIKAEAAARGWGGDASALYKSAITASMEYWGVAGADITTYLARPDVNIAVTSTNYKEVIGNQKWLALYNRGYDAWVEWRRLDFPQLTPAVSQKNPFPLRYPYTTGEYNLNGANVAEAAAKIPGGDKADSKVFWDVN